MTLGARTAIALAVAALALAAATTNAAACSCFHGDPRKMLVDADAAFVGRLVEQPSRSSSSTALVPYAFEVDRAIKGRLPRRIEVYGSASSASCGIEAPVGQPIGLYLSREGGRWHSSLCQQVSPADLLAAARPLPAPTGKGPAALLAGGSFGDVRTIALDRQGRTLGYGRGRGETILLDGCPGGKRAAEIARTSSGFVLAVRELDTLRLVRERPLRLSADLRPDLVDCRSRNADTILLFARTEVGPLGVISEHRGARSRVLHRSEGVAAVFGSRSAYLVSGTRADRLVAVDLANGRERRLARVPAGTGSLALSPDGTRLAAVAYSAPAPGAPRSRVVALDLRGGTPTLRSTPLRASNVSGTIGWLDNRSFAFLPDGYGVDALRVYDTSLRLRARVEWPAGFGVVRKGVAYGVTGEEKARVLQVSLPGGAPHSNASLPGRTVNVLATVAG